MIPKMHKNEQLSLPFLFSWPWSIFKQFYFKTLGRKVRKVLYLQYWGLGSNVSVVVRGERKQTQSGLALSFKFLTPLAGPGPLGLSWMYPVHWQNAKSPCYSSCPITLPPPPPSHPAAISLINLQSWGPGREVGPGQGVKTWLLLNPGRSLLPWQLLQHQIQT